MFRDAVLVQVLLHLTDHLPFIVGERGQRATQPLGDEPVINMVVLTRLVPVRLEGLAKDLVVEQTRHLGDLGAYIRHDRPPPRRCAGRSSLRSRRKSSSESVKAL